MAGFTDESGRVDCGNGNSGDCDGFYAGEYEEADVREVYIVLDGEISYKRELSDDQQKHVQSSDLVVQGAPGTYSFGPNPVIYIPVNLINVGRGVAISARVGINPKHDDWEGVYYLTVKPGDSFYVGIYIDTSDEKVCGEYELRLVFFDHLGCLYMQRFELNVLRESAGDVVNVQMAYYGPRELLSDEERERYLDSLKKSLLSF